MAEEFDPLMIEDYVAESNGIFDINFSRNGKPVFEDAFKPFFTYPIFGEDESIVGYKDPHIDLTFDAYTLQPRLQFKFKDKFRAIGKTKAMDVIGQLQEFLPSSAFDTTAGASSEGSQVPETWTPPGRRVRCYARGGRTFEVWCSSLDEQRSRDMLRNMRILVVLFIEGGLPCPYLDDPEWSLSRWKLWLLYETTNDTYTLAGFSTSYKFWVFPSREVRTALGARDIPTPPPEEVQVAEFDDEGYPTYDKAHPAPRAYRDQLTPPPRYPDAAPAGSGALFASSSPEGSEAAFRERISQFIILPPFHKSGHGPALYDTMVDVFRSDSSVFEITIEDPNEAMDEMRDYQDLEYLRSVREFESLTVTDRVSEGSLSGRDSYAPIEQLVDFDMLERLRHSSKIMPRQFMRLVEMQLYSSIPSLNRSNDRLTRKARAPQADDRRFYFLRLLMKYRIFIKNKDLLIQIDEMERPEKIAATVDSQIAEYETRLATFASRRSRFATASDGAANGAAPLTGALRHGKGRRIVRDDDDDDEDADAAAEHRPGAAAKAPLAKKPRLA